VALGIILAAFGSQATVRVGRIIMAGAAGISVGLFLILLNSEDDRNEFVLGHIEHVDANKYAPFMRFSKDIFGKITPNVRNPNNSRFEFIIFRHEIDGPILTVEFARKDDVERYPEFQIKRQEIESKIGLPNRVFWKFNEDEGTIVDLEDDREVARWSGRVRELAESSQKESRDSGFVFGFVNTALAQPAPADVGSILQALKSDNVAIRRAARKELSNVPPSYIPSIMDTLRGEFNIYRTQLGIAVALTEMLRRDKNLAGEISDELEQEDIDLLVQMAGHQDRTLRIYATEFLFDLGDPRSVAPAVRLAAGTDNADERYNLLFLTQSGLMALDDESRKSFQSSIGQIGSNSGQDTQELIKKLQSQ